MGLIHHISLDCYFAMNSMLILLFTFVSLLTGSSLATEEVTGTTAAPTAAPTVAPTAAPTAAPTDAPTAAPAASYYAFDGCSDYRQTHGRGQGWKEGILRPGYYDSTKEVAQIVCCEDGKKCSRRPGGDCRSGHSNKVKVTWEAARAHCQKAKMRLCASQAELDSCCEKGCQYDNTLVWSSVVEGDQGAPNATTEGGCQVFPDCKGKCKGRGSRNCWCDTEFVATGVCSNA